MRLNALMLMVYLPVAGALASVPQDTLREVVRESRLPRQGVRLTAPAPTETLGDSAMQELGLRGVADALRLMGGVAVRDYGGLGGMKTVSIRGLSPQHTAVMLDGMPVSNSQAGQIDLSRFATHGMESVRLHIGGADRILSPALLGAYAGAVEMTSRDSAREVSLDYGTWNTLQAALLLPHASLLYSHTDGDYPFTLRNGQRDERLHRDHGRVDAAQLTLPWTVECSPAVRVTANAQAYWSHRALPGAVIYYNNEGTEQLWDLNAAAQARLDIRLAPEWKMTAGVKYNYGWNKYFDASLVTDGADGTSRYRQNEYYLTAGLAWLPLPSLSLALVHDSQWASLRTNLRGGEQPDRWVTWNALRAQWHTPRLSIEGEVLYTHETRRETLSDEGLGAASRWTPSLAASFRPVAACRSLYLRASWRRSFRLPSFNDLYYYRLGNHDLRPEKASETNVGLTYGWTGDTWSTNLTADFYWNSIDDKIVAFPTTFAWRMTNFGRVAVRGLDFGMTTSWQAGRNLSLDGTLHVAWQEADDRTDYDTSSLPAVSTSLPYTPAWTGNAALWGRTPWVTLGWTLSWMGERWSNVMRSDRYRLGSFAEHGFTLSPRPVYLKGVELSLRASLLNAFDSHYEIVQYYPMPGRQWRVALTARF